MDFRHAPPPPREPSDQVDKLSELSGLVMHKNCHTCRYHLVGESNPYTRCLHFYNKGIAIEALKSGLIGECDEHKPIDA